MENQKSKTKRVAGAQAGADNLAQRLALVTRRPTGDTCGALTSCTLNVQTCPKLKSCGVNL
jgi:hypothetical protein